MTDWWKLGSNITFARSNFNTPYFTADDRRENFFYHLQSKYTTQPVYNPDGTFTQDGGGTVVGIPRDGGRRITGTNETRLAFDTQIDILKDVWFVKGDINYVFNNTAVSHTEIPVYYRSGPALSPSVTWGTSNSRTREDANTSLRSVINLYTDFHKTFGGKHFVQALAGFNQEEYRSDALWVEAENLTSESYPTLALTTGPISKGKTVNALALRGWFGRLNYIYDNRYIVEFNGRRDASSRFPEGSRWGFFPSASAAWVASNEKWLEPVTGLLSISNLKLRGSYGSLGNQNISGYYPFYPSMGTTSQIDVILEGERPMSVNAPGTPAAGDLTWEKVRSVNFGIDLALFNNRFDLSFDKYTRYTEGMLTLSKELPAVFGASPPLTNAADLETRGWDLNIGWRDKFSLAGSPFNYSVRVMISDAVAKITKFDNPEKRYNDWYVGKEPGEIWGFVTAGFFNTEEEIAGWYDQTAVSSGSHGNRPYLGDVKYMNLDGDRHVNADGKAQINRGSSTVDDPGDRKIIGNTSIHFPYSFDVSADWKGFDFRAFFQGVGKREVYPNGVFFFGMHSGRWTNPIMKELDYWGVPEDYNPDAYFPRLTSSVRIAGGDWAQTKYLQNAAYLRLKNLTLGYTIPQALTERWKISRLRVFFSGENLLTFDHFDVSGIDPETANHGSSTNTTYFPAKVYSFGLNLSF
jgi:TonB-linked SusC/RagA family outer membrane protein